jgi:hypothetical protein
MEVCRGGFAEVGVLVVRAVGERRLVVKGVYTNGGTSEEGMGLGTHNRR